MKKECRTKGFSLVTNALVCVRDLVFLQIEYHLPDYTLNLSIRIPLQETVHQCCQNLWNFGKSFSELKKCGNLPVLSINFLNFNLSFSNCKGVYHISLYEI